MPDVYEAVNKLTEACTTCFDNKDDASKKDVIDAFLALPQEKRPTMARGKMDSQIKEFFNSLYLNIKNKISEHFHCEVLFLKEDSKNNKEGSDLIATLKYKNRIEEERIELKFGQETLKAPGLKTFDKIFVVDTEKGYFKKIFAVVKKNQRNFASNNKGKTELIVSNLGKQLSPIVDKCNDLNNNGHLSINSNEMAAQLSSTGSVNSEEPLIIPTKFKINWNSISVSEKLDLTGDWKITEISSSGDDGGRMNFVASNGKVITKFLLNWKNNLLLDGVEYPSKTGVNTYCFNVWAWQEEDE